MAVIQMVDLDTLFGHHVWSNYMVSVGSFLDCGASELVCIWTNI